MAKHQYRICSTLDWGSSAGSGVVVIQNPNGSGRKITVRSVEFNNLSTSTGTVGPQFVTVSRATGVGGGLPVPLTPLDTSNSLPSGVRVETQSGFTGDLPLAQYAGLKNLDFTTPGLKEFSRNRTYSPYGGIYAYAKGTPAVEQWTIRTGEGIVATSVTAGGRNMPVRVSGMLLVDTDTFVFDFYTSIITASSSAISIVNDSASSVVKLLSLGVEEFGTNDTPYFQVVPLGPLDSTAATDPAKTLSTVLKLDTASPDPVAEGWVKVFKDAAIFPSGMPEDALNPGSAGNPKFVNYLKTKDFLGPSWRNYFPEFLGTNNVTTGLDSFGNLSQRRNDLLVRRGGYIVLREGEGLAIVSSAETATGTFIGKSGWQFWEFGITFDVEPKLVPTLNITGLQNPSEVRVFKAGTTTEVAGQESITSGTFSWEFDPDIDPSVDISILALGYQNFRLTDFALSLADVTIPVQQQLDRQYLNP